MSLSPLYSVVCIIHIQPCSKVCENALKAVAEVCAIDSAAFENQAHGHRRENEKSLFYFGCDFSGWYNFEKIIKTVATRCHILRVKCAEFDFVWSVFDWGDFYWG